MCVCGGGGGGGGEGGREGHMPVKPAIPVTTTPEQYLILLWLPEAMAADCLPSDPIQQNARCIGRLYRFSRGLVYALVYVHVADQQG